MNFEKGRKYGKLWEDAQKLHEIILKYPFHTTGKKERDFENGFANTLMSIEDNFNAQIITQIDKETTVKSVYCFGKKHRPDLTFDENGIAIELKYITYAGLKEAIGQGYLYRLNYKFVFLIFIISEDKKNIYLDIAEGKEEGLSIILEELADEMNVFSYVVPAFSLKKHPGVKRCYSFFKKEI